MRTTNVFLSCLSLLVLAAPGASLDRNPASCGAIQITAPGAPVPPKRKAKRKPTFSASSILDLKFEVGLPPALKGPHTLELKVFTPKGHLYQTLSAAIRTPAGAADQRTRGAGRTASALLPVAGTTIVNNSLYGEWKVEAFLDGERTTACTKALSFLIEP